MTTSSPFPPEFDGELNQLTIRIQQADALEQAQRADEAQAAYNACLEIAARERTPLWAGQLVHIWMGLGFCRANRSDWGGALEWYHRAEALILSAPMFNRNPKSPGAEANTQKWVVHLPEGVHVLFPQSYPAEAALADLYDSIALAYDNSNQLERAQQYYRCSTDLHTKLGNATRAAEVWRHQAIGCQRRQEWFGLEYAAEMMLLAATHAHAQPMLLAARRFLAQAHINQNRPFKTLEHLGQAVAVGRELKDADVARDERLLQDLIHGLRPSIFQRGQADFLEALVYAETIINDPNLAHDKAMLQQWEGEQPATILPGSMPVGPLNSLQSAAMMLEHFALRHCGAPTQTEKHTKKRLMGLLGGATSTLERRVWAITQEEMQVFKKDAQGQLTQRKAPCAVLTLFGEPEAIVSVSLTMSECDVMVMEARAVTGVEQTGFFSVAHEHIAAHSDTLLQCLSSFIQRGLFATTDRGLRYVRPKKP